MSHTVEIRTIIGYAPLEWVPILSTHGGADEERRAIAYARTLMQGFDYGQFSKLAPNARVIDGDGKVVPYE